MIPHRLPSILVVVWSATTFAPSRAAPASDCWERPPEPDPKAPADFVAWAQACAQQDVTDNAWDVYKQIEKQFVVPTAKERLTIDRAVRWPWEDQRFEPAAGWLASAAGVFDLLRLASERRHCAGPLERHGPYLLNVGSGNRSAIRIAVRGMAADAWRRFYKGDPRPLQRDSPVVLRIVHHLDAAITASGRTGRGTLARIVYRDLLLQMLDRSSEPASLAAQLVSPLREADPPFPGCRRAVMMQYALLADLYQRIYDWDNVVGRYVMDQAELDPVREKFRKLSTLSEDEIVNTLLLSDYQESIDFIKQYHARLAKWVDLSYVVSREKLQELHAEISSSGTDLTRATVRSFRAYAVERQKTVAARRATRLIYAIWAHRHERNEFPESFDELHVPDLADLRRDPFSQGDFVYRRTSDGFTLYSLGLDCADQDGSHQEDWGEKEPGDYVFWPVQPITPPWLRPRILITSDGRMMVQERTATQPAETAKPDTPANLDTNDKTSRSAEQ